MLAALGARATPAGVLDGGGTGLVDVVDLDLDDALAAVASSAVEFATDLDIPLVGPRGVARGGAAQRGADHATVHGLEESMAAWGALLGRSPSGRRVSVALGAGAGGGLGAGLLRLGARRVPGVSTVAAAADLPAQLDAADLVLTGCRSLDGQSLRGTVVADVAREALDRALPVIVLAGQLEVSRREWITAGVTTAFPCRAEPGQPLAQAVATAAARAARTWSR